MFSAIYNWLFPSKKTKENGLDNEIQYERAKRLPFAWKCESSKKTTSENISIIKNNNQKLSKIHCDSDQRILYANEYKSQSKSLSNKIKD
jgi:hypothetical protein